jgi:DNA-binding LacI/PurR family transcriptional regulator
MGGKQLVSELTSALNQHVSLAVLLDHTRETERMIAAAGVPYVLMEPAPQTNHPAGYLEGCSRETAGAIAAHCAACGARHVLLAGLPAKRDIHLDDDELRAALEGHFIETRRIEIGRKGVDMRTEEILQETVAYFARATAGGALDVHGFRPDMVVFLDDYVAQGALLIFTAAGIRVPEDLQVISMANKGLGPVWLKPLTRFEVDAAKEADAIAELAVACLRDRTRRHVRKSSVTFIEGATTRRA